MFVKCRLQFCNWCANMNNNNEEPLQTVIREHHPHAIIQLLKIRVLTAISQRRMISKSSTARVYNEGFRKLTVSWLLKYLYTVQIKIKHKIYLTLIIT